MSPIARFATALALALLALQQTALAAFQDPEQKREEIPAEAPPQHELWIVDAATQAPLADVPVRYVDIDQKRWFELYALGMAELVKHIESEGSAHVSDARGLVRLPKARATGIALARDASRIGMWTFDEQEPGPWTLGLVPDGPWDVYVFDPRGAPIAGMWMRVFVDGESALLMLRTDDDGRARLEHAALQLAAGEGKPIELVPYALLREPARLRVEGPLPPKEPSEFLLPELGLVELVLREPEGGPWAYENHRVWVRHARGKRDAQIEEKQQIANLWWGEQHGYRVHVERGLEVEAGWSAAGVREDVIAHCVGPSHEQGIARVELALTPAAPVARMRVLDENGKPLVKTNLSLVVRNYGQLGGGRAGLQRATDDAATLYVPLDDRYGGDGSFAVTIALPDRPEVQAVRAFTPQVTTGWIELGDVKLALAPVLAAGRVVDAEDEPMAHAEVELRGVSVPSGESARFSQFEGNELSLGPSWTVRTDANGVFELRAAETVTRVKATLKRHAFARGPWVEGAAGSRDFVIRAPRPTSAQGRLLLPAGFEAREFSLRLSRPSSSWETPELAPDGTWAIQNLEPGRWWVEVVDASVFSWEWLARAEFDIAEGQVVHVHDLDLRALRAIHIRVVDERGEPIDASGSFEAQGRSDGTDIEARAGRARLLTRHARVNAWLEAPGRFNTGALDVQDGAVLVLPTAGRVRVRLSNDSALPPSPLVLFAVLTWGDERAIFDLTRVAELPATIRGEQHVHLCLRDPRLDPDRGPTHVGVGNPKFLRFAITIPDSSETTEIEVQVTAEHIAEAQRRLEAMGRERAAPR